MTPERQARQKIDKLLEHAGWMVQNRNQLNLGASLGVAVREYPMQTGPVDYLLFVNRKPVGVIEAKKTGVSLIGVADQSERYSTGIPSNLSTVDDKLAFNYESTGTETFFRDLRDLRDPEPRSRRLFAFHKPETLQGWIEQVSTLHHRLALLPELDTETLRKCQIEAVTNLEKSFKRDDPRALIQMATGSGKTYTAITFIYRLLQHAKAKRVLFLVDRSNLGKQAFKEFQQFATPDDGRKFTELYNVQHLQSNAIDDVNKVTITTIQRLYSMLRGEKNFDESLENESAFQSDGGFTYNGKEVVYNPEIPIETFDFIVTDECHRSIYNLWRQVLEYFDSYIIGLTATPSKQTYAFFNQNIITEYSHERAVADNVNVPFDVYRIKTKISEKGSKIESEQFIDKRDRDTREIRWEQLDEDLQYESKQLDKDVVAIDQIRTIIQEYKRLIEEEIFPEREHIPKTLIFAKTDSHADDIVQIVREVFGKGNDFCKKITYQVDQPENVIKSFRNSYDPRIAVSVDMVSTGTDIKPLEVLIFMRDVKSRVYFEQMKGRGTRTVNKTDLRSVTPDAPFKNRFVIIDAVGVTESKKTDSRPLERKPSVPLKNLLNDVAVGNRDTDILISLANRLARLNNAIEDEDREKLAKENNGKYLNEVVNNLMDAIDPDVVRSTAKETFETSEPAEKQLDEAKDDLALLATTPFDNPKYRNLILEIKSKSEQIIDKISSDVVEDVEREVYSEKTAERVVDSFEKFLDENKDELLALQIIYNRPYRDRHLTYQMIRDLADALVDSGINQDMVWNAYSKLKKSRVKNECPDKLLTNIISLVRFASGQQEDLDLFANMVEENFTNWIKRQRDNGMEFSDEQVEWLRMIKDYIARNASIDTEDFQSEPFFRHGGVYKVSQVFGERLPEMVEELNYVLVDGIKR